MLNQHTTLIKYIRYLFYKITTPKLGEMPAIGNCDSIGEDLQGL